jgi:transcription initiation factor TFIIIB Brf1 subunit/transcription initiation factor TFIIB
VYTAYHVSPVTHLNRAHIGTDYIDGHTPRTKGATALYIALRDSGHKYSQQKVGEAFGLAEYTVREYTRKMDKVRDR